MIKKIVTICILAIFTAVLFATYSVYDSIQNWSYRGTDTIFQINSGETFSKINYRLSKRKLISSAKIFYRYAKINNLLTKFKSGNYLIKTNSNMLDIIETLTSGKAITTKITIPEGKNLFEIGKILEKNEICTYSSFISLAKDPTFTKKMGIKADRIEGYLYPDTYQFSTNTLPELIIKTMVNEFKNKTKDLDFSLSSMSKHQVIILASIVEKETGAKHERAIIAGVFMNRLKKRMRLQTDPTIIYGIYENFDGNIRRVHKGLKTPYNTYRISGLPVGPISNPGDEAIRAVLNPRQHNYLYFVSKNDGTHIFSTTYKNHIKGVDRFQKNYKNRVGKSWRDLKQKTGN